MIGEATYKGVLVPVLERQQRMDKLAYSYEYLVIYDSQPIWVQGQDLEDLRIWPKGKISSALSRIKVAKFSIARIKGLVK